MSSSQPDDLSPAFASTRERPPSLASAIIFRGKAAAFQLRRAAENTLITRPGRFSQTEREAGPHVAASASAPLWKDVAERERRLQAGKIHNLRIALCRINNIKIPAGETFSFWRHIGHPGRWQGFVEGRELREGCIIPSIGGGLCQLSNTLYQAALGAGFEIVERHAHSRILPGSAAEAGRDATVFWNYVDLRLRHHRTWRIEALMTAETLTVNFYECEEWKSSPTSAWMQATLSPQSARELEITRDQKILPSSVKQTELVSLSRVSSVITRREVNAPVNSCEDCGVQSCFRHIEPQPSAAHFGRTAFLVDEYWPEFDSYIQSTRESDDLICVPVDGARYKQANYGWSVEGFRRVKQSRIVTLKRAWASRRLAAQGAIRQQALLHYSALLARQFARALAYDITHLTIKQDFLAFLWREGHLGGRTFDVLMTRLPLSDLHARLDAAAQLYPESRTLADFRGSTNLVEAERRALQAAERIITPHAEIARLFPQKSVKLEWHLPELRPNPSSGNQIIFPASVLGRKGAYEMRAAAEKLKLKLTVCGAELEGEDFWGGLEVEHRRFDSELLNDAALIVLPAHVENKPRRLLSALAHGTPVVASEACGLQNLPDLYTVPTGNTDALCETIKRAMRW